MSLENPSHLEEGVDLKEATLAAKFDKKLRDMPHTPKDLVAQLFVIEMKIEEKPEKVLALWKKHLPFLRAAYANEKSNSIDEKDDD